MNFKTILLSTICTVIAFTSCLSANQPWDRVYLATYPRSGNHWVRFLIEEATHIATSSVYLESYKNIPHLATSFPWGGFSCENGYFGMCRYPEPGEPVVIKTHFPFFEAQAFDKQPYKKAINIVRNPVDSFYSLYIYLNNDNPPSPNFPSNKLKEFINKWDNFQTYWSKQPNVITIRYEDIQADPKGQLRLILKTAGYSYTEADIERAVALHPPQGETLKHISHFTNKDLKKIKKELKGWLKKFHYTIPVSK